MLTKFAKTHSHIDSKFEAMDMCFEVCSMMMMMMMMMMMIVFIVS